MTQTAETRHSKKNTPGLCITTGRKNLIVHALAVIALLMFPSVAAAGPSVIIKDYTVTPSVLMPGETGTLTVVLKATTATTQQSSVTYGTDVASTTVSITPYVDSIILKSDDIEVMDGKSNFEGNIGPDQEIPVTFLITAPQRSGVYFPEVWIRIDGGRSLKYPVPVNVNTQVSVLRTPSLTLDNTFEEQVRPGSRVRAELIIGNTGSSQADNIQVHINGSPPYVIPAGVSTFQIESLKPGQENRQNVTLLIDKNAPTGLIQVPVTVRYAVLDGTIMEQPGSIGLDVRGHADIGITSVETIPSRVSADTPFDLLIRIQNTGTGEAKTVDAVTDLPIAGAGQAFIGKIKSGNDAPATFILEAAPAGTYNYTATITYTDDWGTHTLKKDLILTVAGGDGSGTVILIILLLVVIGGGGFWYLRRRNGEE